MQFKLTGDTYAMAYKALSKKVCEEINLSKEDWNNAFKAACTVFSI